MTINAFVGEGEYIKQVPLVVHNNIGAKEEGLQEGIYFI
jgi:hypothetical protein